ncbi:MAG: hypothetical protein H6748_11405 [Spirochaetaceae bacterium]|nr:hypothetical protein [Myxococcales bacterium]MCB9724642.1 hypothetical protein [Spirochaetaceae bacterium]HPG24261.1 hypothetical protein [Myxococcota bacterium]
MQTSSGNSAVGIAGRFDPFRTPRRAFVLAVLAVAGLVAGTLALNGLGELGWRTATRLSARLAFPFFLTAFVASPLARLWPTDWSRGLRRRRRSIGVAYATLQTGHALVILQLARLDDTTLGLGVETVIGGLGIALAIAMGLSSNDAAVRALGGRRWIALHRTGMVVIFLIYLSSYGGRFAADPAAWWPGFGALVAALGLRGAAALQSRSLRSRMLPTE